MREKIQVLDHGYASHVESWGIGDAGVPEAGIIEAARQSTQGNFNGWGTWKCDRCNADVEFRDLHQAYGTNVTCQTRIGPEGYTWDSRDERLLAYLFNSNPPPLHSV